MCVFFVCGVLWYVYDVYVGCVVCMHVWYMCVCVMALLTTINEMKITPHPTGTPGVHLPGDSRAHNADNSSSVPLTSPV